MKGLFCLLLATPRCSWTMKVKGRCLSRLRWAMGSIRAELSLLWPHQLHHRCAHTLPCPRPGRVQSKQCSHLLEDIKSPRVVLCSPPKSALLWFLMVSYERSLHHGLFIIVGILLFQLHLFFRVSKAGKGCRTDSHQEYHNKSQVSVHVWVFKAGIPKWRYPLCKPSLPRIFVSERRLTPSTLICQVFLGKGCAVVTCPEKPTFAHVRKSITKIWKVSPGDKWF